METIYTVNTYAYVLRYDLRNRKGHKHLDPLDILCSRAKNKLGSVILLVSAQKDVQLPLTASEFVEKMAKNTDPKPTAKLG